MGTIRSWTRAPLEELVAEAQVRGMYSRATTEVIRQFEPLTMSLGARYAAGKPHRDDIENAARYALTQAIQRHRGPIETFPAYAKRYMTGAASRELGRWLAPAGTAIIAIADMREQDIVKAMLVEAAWRQGDWGDGATADIITKLDSSRQRLLARRYIADEELAEIAADAGTSVSAVSQRLSAVHRKIRAMLAA
jgi:DNA-directed RNA polymerase specialized sigma subunit